MDDTVGLAPMPIPESETELMSPEEEALMKDPKFIKHIEEVAQITSSIKRYYEAGEKFRIHHGSTNSTRPTASKSANTVDTSRLNNVIAIDAESMVVVVEPNVPMDALLEETLRNGLMPLVITEFPGITVGGAFSGTAGESSSFKHGYFDQSVTKLEIILANGDKKECSDRHYPDLFKGAAGTLGTLGVVTLLHVKLQKACKYVEVAYHYHPGAATCLTESLDQLQKLANVDAIDFLDGIMFSSTKIAIITGRMVDTNEDDLPVQRFIRPKDPWYFTHVESCITENSSNAAVRELVPLPDYLFRYNRGIFWLGKQTFDILGINNSARTRKLLHHAFTARMGYARLHQQQVNTTLIQDLAIPFPAAEEFIDWLHEKYDIYPLWLCPLRVPSKQTLHPHLWRGTERSASPNIILNVGLYDVSARSYDDWINQNRELENKVHDLGGMKWSYAAQIYPEDKFWEQHDREWYDGLREKYGACSLSNIYDKTHVNVEVGRELIEDSQPKTWFRRTSGHVTGMVRYARAMLESIRSGVWKQERSPAWYEWPVAQ